MIFGLPKYGKDVGFRRLLAYCDVERIDLARIGRSAIVVTGSNGKGSTARFVYECLRANVERVGCFTSPHLFAINERFEISGVEIDGATLASYSNRVLAFHATLQRQNDGLGAFEALFLIALSWFHDCEVDCTVWEAGIGGRYDPVRVLRSPIAALTSIDLEHTELLGATRQLIAFDKLDATRPGSRTFVSAAVDAQLAPDLEAYGRVTDRSLAFIRAAAVADVVHDRDRTRYRLSLPDRADCLNVAIPLAGMHQVHNSVTALHVIDAFLARWDTEATLRALERIRWPGRLERIHHDPEIWIDVGHTPEAITRVTETLTSLFDARELLVVFGVSDNKAIAEIARIVRSHFPHVLVTRAYKHGSDPERLSEEFAPSQLAGVTRTIEEAVARSQSIAAARGWKIAVIGGLFLSIEFAQVIRGGDPRTLDFF